MTQDTSGAQISEQSETIARGRQVLEALAPRFPQLYVRPSQDAAEAHGAACRTGVAPQGATLDHFETSPNDEFREVSTPAGPIEVVYFEKRRDFETFMQIIGNKSRPDPISKTIGASTFLGLADWGKVAAARTQYLGSGGTDWSSEFARLAKEPGAFRSQIIVVSNGPYSNIPHEMTPYDEAEWLRLSLEIRLHHECAHVVCRRLLPNDVLAVWDEVTADVTGLVCATGRYDAQLAALFLGVGEEGYRGGRLVEYLSDEQKERLDTVAHDVWEALTRIEADCTPEKAAKPFEYLIELKKDPFISF